MASTPSTSGAPSTTGGSLGSKLSIDDVDFSKGPRVLMRVDFNVPFQKGVISDTARITAAIPSINAVLEKGGSLVLMSHLGRPDGCVKPEFTLAPVAAKLAELLGRPVELLNDCVGAVVEERCAALRPGEVILLENLRFHAEEEGSGVSASGKFKPSPEQVAAFRASLSRLGDVYINDAFGTAHRAHSSMVGVSLSTRAAGYLMQKELQAFSKIVETPVRPLVAILGGAKVSDKIQIIDNLLDRVDVMVIGGGMAFTFTKVLYNMNIGKSLFDQAGADLVSNLMAKAHNRGVRIVVPTDFVTGDAFSNSCNVGSATLAEGIPSHLAGYDIGPKTVKAIADVISEAATVVWNGPMGVFEFDNFSHGTRGVMDACVRGASAGKTIVLGGGETASCAALWGVSHLLTHVSTGGGASLELLEGKELPGVAFLSNKIPKPLGSPSLTSTAGASSAQTPLSSSSRSGSTPSTVALSKQKQKRNPLGRLWAAYQAALQRNPRQTKYITAGALSGLGDLIAQLAIERRGFDLGRLLKFVTWGVLVTPLCDEWYLACDRFFDGRKQKVNAHTTVARTAAFQRIAAPLERLAVDQLVFAPLLNALFYVYMAIVNNRSDKIGEDLRNKLLMTVVSSWKVWPVAQMINFQYIPPNSRILFSNFIGLFWGVYLSLVAARK